MQGYLWIVLVLSLVLPTKALAQVTNGSLTDVVARQAGIQQLLFAQKTLKERIALAEEPIVSLASDEPIRNKKPSAGPWSKWAEQGLATGAGLVESTTFTAPIRLPRCNYVDFAGKSARLTELKFVGLPAGEPAIAMPWNRAIDFRDITFVRDTPGPIFFIYGKEASWYTFRNCEFQGVDDGKGKVTAVVLGDGQSGNNSDTAIIDRCVFLNCQHALVMNHLQSLLCAVRDSRMYRGDSLIRILRGGDVLVENTSLYNVPTCVHTTNFMSANNASINFINTRMDGDRNWRRGFTLCNASKATAHVQINVLGGTLRKGNAEKQGVAILPGKRTKHVVLGLQNNDTPLFPEDASK